MAPASASGALHRLFEERGLPLTVFASALALERNPEVAEAIAASDWDVVCPRLALDRALPARRGDRARPHRHGPRLARAAPPGATPEGWYCRYGPSPNTRRLVVEHGGFGYDSDAYDDELPYWVDVEGKPHLVVPYCLATNDAKLVGGAARSRGAPGASS